jgi:catechol 2,3-dioxygenase-like lactoylglutathione lyase family enzyme
VQRLRDNDVEISPASAADQHARRVTDMVATTAPWGTRIELGWGLCDGSLPFASDLVPGGFVTDGVGLGHVLFGLPGTDQDFTAADAFATTALGMRETLRIQLPINGKPSVGTFYRCNPRHHSLALIRLPDAHGPAPLHHIMFQATSDGDVRAAYQRATASGVPIAHEPGRHGDDGMFSFYAISPAGIQFEIGAGGVLMHDNPPE